jgi:hypothetical protein
MVNNMFCIALSWEAWLDSMALIIYVNSLMGSVEEDLLSDATSLSLDSDCLEVLPLVKPGRLDFPDACIFFSILFPSLERF